MVYANIDLEEVRYSIWIDECMVQGLGGGGAACASDDAADGPGGRHQKEERNSQ